MEGCLDSKKAPQQLSAFRARTTAWTRAYVGGFPAKTKDLKNNRKNKNITKNMYEIV